MTPPLIVPVGGFLGSGKTTLILEAARRLRARNVKTAVVVNDQGGALVDHSWARTQGLPAHEVTGGCFCCRFTDLRDALHHVHDAQVIFAEPVGSCTDIANTVLRPLERFYPVAPFTVLVDDDAVNLYGHDDSDLSYLFHKQLEEADLVCLSKIDQGVPSFPAAHRISSRTGEGIDPWLADVLSSLPSTRKTIDVDYVRYGRAESALGWMNARGQFAADPPVSPAQVIGPLLDAIATRLDAASLPLIHLKAIIHAETGYVKAALSRNGGDPEIEGDLTASPSTNHHVLINLRALAEPFELERITREAAQIPAGHWLSFHIDAFRPNPPTRPALP